VFLSRFANNTLSLSLNTVFAADTDTLTLKGIVHFEIKFWYVLAYLKGIQDVGVFVSTVFLVKPLLSISHTLEAKGVHQKACTEKSKLNMI